MKLIDLTGKIFGRLTVLERDWEYQKNNHYDKPYWKCQCSCGKITTVMGKSLRDGKQLSCGCLIKEKIKNLNFVDISGKQYGKLTVLKYVDNSKWECRCDCGSVITVSTCHLNSGHTLSCGCLRSKGERIISQWLDDKKILYKKQYTNSNLRNEKGNLLKVDFAIFNNDKQLVGFIEYNGIQHYDKTDNWYKPEIEENQKSKQEYALCNNLFFYIISYKDNIEEKLTDYIFKSVDFSEIKE